MLKKSIAPVALFQKDLTEEFLSATISPNGSSLLILDSKEGISSCDQTGEEKWRFELPFKPTAFASNAFGDAIAVIGDGVLGILEVSSQDFRSVAVNAKITKVDFHRNQVLLGGFDKRLFLYSLSGKLIRTLQFDYLIRDFKAVPESDAIILYNEHLRLVSADGNGETEWETDSVRLAGQIETTRKGRNNYCLTELDGILQFSVPDQLFFEVNQDPPVRIYSASQDGRLLLTFNANRELVLYDKGNRVLWRYQLVQPISLLKISPDGGTFITVDEDRVLTYHSLLSDGRKRTAFLEIQEGNENILEKLPAWSKQPGFPFSQERKPQMLSVSSQGNRAAVIGLDGGVYFLDKQGNLLFDMKFPALVEEISFSNAGNHASIYGGKRVAYINLLTKENRFVELDFHNRGKPVFNFHHERIFMVSDEGNLLVLDLEGKAVAEQKLGERLEKGTSCREMGVLLYNEDQFSGYSDEGRKLFSYRVQEKINNAVYHEGNLLVTTKSGSLLAFDLKTMKGRKKLISARKKALRILNANPLLLSDEEEKAYWLNTELSVERSFPLLSANSHFLVEKGEILEIVPQRKQLSCRNEERTLWRYKSNEHIRESILTPAGLYFLTDEAVNFIPLGNEGKGDYSHFLEI